MSGRRRDLTMLAAACAATLAAVLCGCAVIGEQYVFERQFTDEQVGMIRNGATTKKDILDRLGPPSAVARPAGGGADNVLRRFAATTGAAAGHVVFCYRVSALEWTEFCAYGQYGGGCIPSMPVTKNRKLWILIDETTGRVVDHSVEETVQQEKGLEVRPWLGPG